MFCYKKKASRKSDRRRSGILAESKYDETTLQNIKYYPKTEHEEGQIRNALRNNEFLSNILQGRRLKSVIDTLYVKDTEENEILIKEGDLGSHLYISLHGKFKITIKEETVAYIDDVQVVFGELAILYNAKRHATVKCLTKGKVWVLDCKVFKALMIKTAIEEAEEMISFLQNVPKLGSANLDILRHVADLLKKEFFASGKEIVREGDEGDKFYIIRAGSVTVSQKLKGEIDQLSKGSFFGELALLKSERRKATVKANPPGVECLTLGRQQFIDHFGEVEEFVNIKLSLEYFQIKKNTLEYKNLDLRDFRIAKTLGIGGYGRVELIQHTRNRDMVFALKYMKLSDIVKLNQQHHISNEKKLQISLNSYFVVRLYRSFKDEAYIYFLLETCLGGDLWTLMRRRSGAFDEPICKFYAACVVEGLSYLHDHGIVYRDLKPENCLISASGYLKLADFGFAKELKPKEKTFTFVGTPEYVAPEIILNIGHNKEVDIWSLGVLIFEMISGRSPFKAQNSLKTYKFILKGIDKVVFPLMTSNAKHLIRKLCREKAIDRLGCQRGGMKSIRNHPWFSAVNWEQLQNTTLNPPFKPALKSKTDTTCFEEFPRDNKIIKLTDLSEWDDLSDV